MHVTEYCRPRRSDLPAAAGSAWNKISWRHQRDGMQGGGEVLGPRSVPRVNEAVRRLRPCRVSSPSAPPPPMMPRCPSPGTLIGRASFCRRAVGGHNVSYEREMIPGSRQDTRGDRHQLIGAITSAPR